jgi:hypothetical protein
MLLKRLLTTKRPIALVAFKDVGWGVQVPAGCRIPVRTRCTCTLERELLRKVRHFFRAGWRKTCAQGLNYVARAIVTK